MIPPYAKHQKLRDGTFEVVVVQFAGITDEYVAEELAWKMGEILKTLPITECASEDDYIN